MGATPEESFLIHNDPDYRVPAGADAPDPATNGQRAEAERRWAEADRLMELGFSRSTALLAATPYGEAVR